MKFPLRGCPDERQALPFSMQNDLLATFFHHTTYLSNHKIFSLPYSLIRMQNLHVLPLRQRFIARLKLLLDIEQYRVRRGPFAVLFWS
jgi:hypothetical protein